MRAENQDRAYWHFFDGFDENRSAAAELIDYVAIVDNFVVNVDWGAVGFKGQLYDIYGADYTGTEAARAYPYQRLGAIGGVVNLRQSQA